MRRIVLATTLLCVGLLAIVPAHAQQGPKPYGAPISLADAKKAGAAAEAYAKEKGWRMVIVIVEPSGAPVYLAKTDDTQYGSVKVATNKATSAAMFRRLTKVFHDLLAKGPEFSYLAQLEGANAVPGGLPIEMDGKIVGAIAPEDRGSAINRETTMAEFKTRWIGN